MTKSQSKPYYSFNLLSTSIDSFIDSRNVGQENLGRGSRQGRVMAQQINQAAKRAQELAGQFHNRNSETDLDI